MPTLLDRNRSYGEVYGSDCGARYVQDGILFDVRGCHLMGPTFDSRKRPTAVPIRAEGPARTDAAIDAQQGLQ